MSMTSQNFFTQKDPKAVATPDATKVTPEKDTPVVNGPQKIHVPTPSNNNEFGKGFATPGSRDKSY